MSYIGNTLQTAFPSYLNIDDISGSFDGVTTSFALTVGGSAPVPAPVSSNQCLISVGGVVQRPDDTGTEGFRLNSGNIVFSSAPGIGEDFFGVILAGADYVNVGVNFPSGTAAAPSITFDTDLDTGIYNPGANEIGFTTAGVNRVTINSSGDVTIVNDLTVDTNTLHVDSTNNRVGIGTTSPAKLLHVQSGSVSGAARGSSFTKTLFESSDALNSYWEFQAASTAKNDILFSKGAAGSYGIVGYDHSADALRFHANSNERARIDSSGRLLVGTSSGPGSGDGQYGLVVVQGYNGLATGPGYLSIQRGNTASNLSSGNDIGYIVFGDSDGNSFATVKCQADATPGSSDYPGRLVFSTTADSASSPTERLTIYNDGTSGFGGVVRPQNNNTFTLGNGTFKWSAVWAVNGTIQTSDQREKTDIATATLGADFIKTLRPVSYKWIEGGQVDSGERDEDNSCIYKSVPGQRTHWGFIAQEVKQAVDAAGVDFGGWVLTDKDDPDSQQALRYDQFIAPLTKALQETMAELEALKAEVAALKAQ